jgi:lysozyme family protein
MVASNWPKALAAVLASEGGNDDDPQDHGGRTSRGITQREYTAWRLERKLPALDVWLAPQSDVERIYYEEYWQPYCDLLPLGVDYLFFDMAVNAGPTRAVVLLQRALGVIADGRFGPVTRRAVATTFPKTIVRRYTNVKREFYLALHQRKFTKGWLNRAAEVQLAAMVMADGGVV